MLDGCASANRRPIGAKCNAGRQQSGRKRYFPPCVERSECSTARRRLQGRKVDGQNMYVQQRWIRHRIKRVRDRHLEKNVVGQFLDRGRYLRLLGIIPFIGMVQQPVENLRLFSVVRVGRSHIFADSRHCSLKGEDGKQKGDKKVFHCIVGLKYQWPSTAEATWRWQQASSDRQEQPFRQEYYKDFDKTRLDRSSAFFYLSEAMSDTGTVHSKALLHRIRGTAAPIRSRCACSDGRPTAASI